MAKLNSLQLGDKIYDSFPDEEARQLIEAQSVLVVTEQDGIASHTPAEIYEHIKEGGAAVFARADCLYYLTYYEINHVSFMSITDERLIATVHVNWNGAVNYAPMSHTLDHIDSTLSKHEQQFDSLSMLDDLRQIITVDENNVPSMTSQEIYSLAKSGGRVMLKYNNRIYSLASCTEHSAYFNYYDETYTMHCIEIHHNQFRDCGILESASTQYVLDQLGPIDEALDAIIAIQNKLIGVTMITFTIDGTEYQAEEGMTWAEYIDSEYNVDNRVLILSNNLIGYKDTDDYTAWNLADADWNIESPNNIIKANYVYNLD